MRFRDTLRFLIRLPDLSVDLQPLPTRIRWLRFDSTKIYAPNINDLGFLQTSTYPEMAADVTYIAGKMLLKLERHERRLRDDEYMQSLRAGRRAKADFDAWFLREMVPVMEVSDEQEVEPRDILEPFCNSRYYDGSTEAEDSLRRLSVPTLTIAKLHKSWLQILNSSRILL
jgi:hypothetical protein